jgi:hypothetical protein
MTVTLGILALLEAKAGNGDELAAFLKAGRELAVAEEGTVTTRPHQTLTGECGGHLWIRNGGPVQGARGRAIWAGPSAQIGPASDVRPLLEIATQVGIEEILSQSIDARAAAALAHETEIPADQSLGTVTGYP